MTTAWPPLADRLWRTAFVVPGAVPPDLDALEERCLSLTLVAIDGDDGIEPVAWRVEALTDAEPDPADLAQLLAGLPGGPPAIEVAQVEAKDWVAASAADQVPVRVGRFFVHAAKDRDLIPKGAVPLEVEAGLAFGSGEHATTQACLEAVDRLARVCRFRRVLDLGCGSGILAMAAARCWPAARVVASDNDPVAVRVAAENVRLNGLAGRVATVTAEGFRHSAVRRGGPYDLVLANILANPLVALAPALARHLAPGGTAVLSGLLDRQADAVEAAYAAAGLRRAGRIARGAWMGLLLRRPHGNSSHG